MRIAAALLLIAGTILATLGGAKLPTAQWGLSGTGLGVLTVGVILWRFATTRAATAVTDAGPQSPGKRAILDALDRAEAELANLQETRSELTLPTVVDRLTELEASPLATLNEQLPGYMAGAAADHYASVLGAEASAQRHVHRAWSAAADGHAQETWASIETARAELSRTRALLQA